MQAQFGDRLGLDQHEAGAEKEERHIAALDRPVKPMVLRTNKKLSSSTMPSAIM